MKRTFLLFLISFFSMVLQTPNLSAGYRDIFDIGVDWLYWEARQDNLASGSFVDDFPNPALKTVSVLAVQPQPKYTSGVRVNLGYELLSSIWDINLTYTYLPIKSKSASFGTLPPTPDHAQDIVFNTTNFPILTAFEGGSANAFSSIFTNWNGNFSYIDADLAHTLAFCGCFYLCPHMGFRAAWMDQKIVVEGDLILPSINGANFGQALMYQKFQGYGIEGGLWTDWSLGCGFSLFGHVGGSLLYSSFKLRQIANGFIGDDLVFIINARGIERTITPTAEYFLGIDYCGTCCCLGYNAHVGWEQRVFFDLNGLSAIGGNFSVQGVTLGLDVMF